MLRGGDTEPKNMTYDDPRSQGILQDVTQSVHAKAAQQTTAENNQRAFKLRLEQMRDASQTEEQRRKNRHEITNIFVSEEKVRDPMNNMFSPGFGIDPTTTDSLNADTWVALPEGATGDKMYMEMKARSDIGKDRGLLFKGKPVFALNSYSGNAHRIVKRSAYAAYINAPEGSSEDIVAKMTKFLDSLERLNSTLGSSVRNKKTKMSYAADRIAQNPQLKQALTTAMNTIRADLGAQIMFYPSKTGGCFTHGDAIDHFNKSKEGYATGTPKNPSRADLFPTSYEKEHNKWDERGLPAIDNQGNKFCLSPYARRRGSKQVYAEEAFNKQNNLYHHMTDLTEAKTHPQKNGRDQRVQETFGQMAFCASERNEEQCKSNDQRQMVLGKTNDKRSSAQICEWNEDEANCQPRQFVKKDTDLYNMYHGKGAYEGNSFVDAEQEALNTEWRRQYPWLAADGSQLRQPSKEERIRAQPPVASFHD